MCVPHPPTATNSASPTLTPKLIVQTNPLKSLVPHFVPPWDSVWDTGFYNGQTIKIIGTEIATMITSKISPSFQ